VGGQPRPLPPVGLFGRDDLVRGPHAQAGPPDAEHAVGQAYRASTAPAATLGLDAVDGVEVGDHDGALDVDGDAGVNRGDERIVEHDVASRAAPDSARSGPRRAREAVPGSHALMTAEDLDDHHCFHSIASRYVRANASARSGPTPVRLRLDRNPCVRPFLLTTRT